MVQNEENSKVIEFKKQLIKLINHEIATRDKINKKEKRGGKPNKKEILAIERSAVEKTWEFYENKGYELMSVETDNVGWDLVAVKEKETLLIEVKGHKGNVIQFELTPNEYTQLKEQKNNYRVCVVRNALTSPDLMEFVPKKKMVAGYSLKTVEMKW
ncbi:protein NO VEIN domain-containing protein [endosymbiont of Riftia pachyptila]|uniref:protein NO VEIN domain-containing protein n=1 Tax=endosymbiont of Riftia pachyptila TaxID=54396 RepID=UPI001F11A7BC|nr:DUF3883 domain-containing protein [endosymbiont of Riftia pachyptila]